MPADLSAYLLHLWRRYLFVFALVALVLLAAAAGCVLAELIRAL